MIVHQLIKDKKIQYDDVILKSVETRFPSRHAVTERVMHHKKVYKTLTKDEVFLVCLHTQTECLEVNTVTLVHTTS